MRYEPVANPRFLIERTDEGELIRIKPRRRTFALLFMPVWLAGWTAGGVLAISQLLQQFSAFLMFWLCGWAVGWLFVAGTISWMIWGSETLRTRGGDSNRPFSWAAGLAGKSIRARRSAA